MSSARRLVVIWRARRCAKKRGEHVISSANGTARHGGQAGLSGANDVQLPCGPAKISAQAEIEAKLDLPPSI